MVVLACLTSMEKQQHCFGFRFESDLMKRVLKCRNSASLSMNSFVKKAFCFAMRQHDRRRVVFDGVSGFISRASRKDKVTTMLVLEGGLRESVRNFSIAYRKSMAEVIRIALELYLDYLDTDAGKNGAIKHYYNTPQPIIECSIIGLYPAFPPMHPPYP